MVLPSTRQNNAIGVAIMAEWDIDGVRQRRRMQVVERPHISARGGRDSACLAVASWLL